MASISLLRIIEMVELKRLIKSVSFSLLNLQASLTVHKVSGTVPKHSNGPKPLNCNPCHYVPVTLAYVLYVY